MGKRRVKVGYPRQTMSWNVAGNYPITLTAGGSSYDLSQHKTGTVQSYSIVSGPSGVAVDSSTGALSATSTATVGVDMPLIVEIDDGQAITAEADWISRSTGPGVVWAHDFRYDDEFTNFLWTDQGVKANGIKPRLVSDYPVGTAGRAVECMSLGAILTADFGLSDTSATFDDLTDWPSGDFYFVMGGDPNVGRGYPTIKYNLFYCPANNGSTAGRFGNELRGVTYDATVANTGSFAATRLPWLAGDNAGHEVQNAWVRTFAALSSGNGTPGGADINNAGVTARAWPAGGIQADSSVGTWGYGFYGHTDYHGLTWTSAQATNSGSSAHGGAWDGDEFYLQMRVKVDSRFWNNHVPTDQTQNTWSHKFFMIQSQQSSRQQLAINLYPKNKYFVPGNTNCPFTWFEHSFNARMELPTSGGSFQPGSPWAATANVYSGTPRPASGQSTPDGSSCWSYNAPGVSTDDWVTLLFHVIPGHDGVTDTFLEVYAARRNGSYTLVWSGNYLIVFDFATTATKDLPGWCAVWLTSYINLFISQTPGIPRKSHFKRWTQLIFSKQFIPAPAVGA